MGKFEKVIKMITELAMTDVGFGRGIVTIYENPTMKELKEIYTNQEGGIIRGYFDTESEVFYMWANSFYHHQQAKPHIPAYDSLRHVRIYLDQHNGKLMLQSYVMEEHGEQIGNSKYYNMALKKKFPEITTL